MTLAMLVTAATVLAATAVLVRRLVGPEPGRIVTPLGVLAVAVSTAALVMAARGASQLAVAIAALGLVAVVVALLGGSRSLR